MANLGWSYSGENKDSDLCQIYITMLQLICILIRQTKVNKLFSLSSSVFVCISSYLSMFSSPWFPLLPSSSTSFLSPQLSSSGLAFTAVSNGVTSHLTPAFSLRLHPWMFWPRDGHSPRNSSFPVHLTWSRWMGPFPWPNPRAATAPALRKRKCHLVHFPFFYLNSVLLCTHTDINLCPSCLHTTAAFRSFQPESQILPQSPWRYTSTRPSFLLLPPTRRTRGPARKKRLAFIFMSEQPHRPVNNDRASFTSTDIVKCHLVCFHSVAILILMASTCRQEKQNLWSAETVNFALFPVLLTC